VHDPFAWGAKVVVVAVVGSYTSATPVLCELPFMLRRMHSAYAAIDPVPPIMGVIVHQAATSPLYCEHISSVKKFIWAALPGAQVAWETGGRWEMDARMAK
jgi:hypothetical protein